MELPTVIRRLQSDADAKEACDSQKGDRLPSLLAFQSVAVLALAVVSAGVPVPNQLSFPDVQIVQSTSTNVLMLIDPLPGAASGRQQNNAAINEKYKQGDWRSYTEQQRLQDELLAAANGGQKANQLQNLLDPQEEDQQNAQQNDQQNAQQNDQQKAQENAQQNVMLGNPAEQGFGGLAQPSKEPGPEQGGQAIQQQPMQQQMSQQQMMQQQPMQQQPMQQQPMQEPRYVIPGRTELIFTVSMPDDAEISCIIEQKIKQEMRGRQPAPSFPYSPFRPHSRSGLSPGEAANLLALCNGRAKRPPSFSQRSPPAAPADFHKWPFQRSQNKNVSLRRYVGSLGESRTARRRHSSAPPPKIRSPGTRRYRPDSYKGGNILKSI